MKSLLFTEYEGDDLDFPPPAPITVAFYRESYKKGFTVHFSGLTQAERANGIPGHEQKSQAVSLLGRCRASVSVVDPAIF